MSQATIYLEAYGLLLGAMTLLWLVSLWRRNASIVDPFWGTTFVVAGWWYFARTPEGDLGRKLLLMVLVTVWGLRLSIYLLWRNWGEPEDPRYQAFRRRYGPERYWWVSFFQVFLLQGRPPPRPSACTPRVCAAWTRSSAPSVRSRASRRCSTRTPASASW